MMKFSTKPIGILCLIFLVVSCQRGLEPPVIVATQKPTIASLEIPVFTTTVNSNPSPTLTSTPQPALVVHEWQPERVLAFLEIIPGDGGGMPFHPPRFTLYANGDLFITRSLGEVHQYREQILFRKLGEREICQNLNTLDQIGFFDYDPSTYEFVGGNPNIKGGPSIRIEVNGWRSHKHDYYELGLYLQDELTGELTAQWLVNRQPGQDDQDGFPIISPSLRSAYYFFVEYPNRGFEIYQPEKLVVWIEKIGFADNSNNQAKAWNLQNMPISVLSNRIDPFDNDSSNDYLVLTGRDASSIFNYIGQRISTEIYYETDGNGKRTYYMFYARPLLPYESIGSYGSQIPAPDSEKPNFMIKCYPSDGVMIIPTPSIP
jgi:hypothetical protein